MAEYIYVTEAKFTVQKKYQSLNRKGNLKKFFGRYSTISSFDANDNNFEEAINEIIDYVENDANPLLTDIEVHFVDDIDHDFKSLCEFRERGYTATKRVCSELRKIANKAIKSAEKSDVPGHLQAAQKLKRCIDSMEYEAEKANIIWNHDLDEFAEEWRRVRMEGRTSRYFTTKSGYQIHKDNKAMDKKFNEISISESADNLHNIISMESSSKKIDDKTKAIMLAKLKALKKKIEKSQKDLPKKTSRIADLARGIKTRIKNTVNKIKKAINKD